MSVFSSSIAALPPRPCLFMPPSISSHHCHQCQVSVPPHCLPALVCLCEINISPVVVNANINIGPVVVNLYVVPPQPVVPSHGHETGRHLMQSLFTGHYSCSEAKLNIMRRILLYLSISMCPFYVFHGLLIIMNSRKPSSPRRDARYAF